MSTGDGQQQDRPSWRWPVVLPTIVGVLLLALTVRPLQEAVGFPVTMLIAAVGGLLLGGVSVLLQRIAARREGGPGGRVG